MESLHIRNIISFYRTTIEKVLGPATLSVCVQQLEVNSKEHFYELIKSQGKEFKESYSADMNPQQLPPQFMDILNQLTHIFKSYEQSMNSEMDQDLHFIAQHLVEPFMKQILETSSVSSVDLLVFKINAFDRLVNVLKTCSLAQEITKKANDQLDQLIQQLVQEQHKFILGKAGLYDLVVAMETEPSPLAHQVRTHRSTIAEALAKLDRFLVDVSIDVQELVDSVSNPLIVSQVTQLGLQKFLDSYKCLVSKIMDPKNKVVPLI